MKAAPPLHGKALISPSSVSPMAAGYPRPQVHTNAMRGSNMQPTAAAASKSPLVSCASHTQGGLFPSVEAMQASLRCYGVPDDPWQKRALTAIAGSRDVSAAAAVKDMIVNADASTKRQIRAMAQKVEEMPGITAPLGFWDPLGFTVPFAPPGMPPPDTANRKADGMNGDVMYYREIEIKHGRVGMLAFLGIVAGETLSPIFGAKPDIPAAAIPQLTYTIESQYFWGFVWAAAAAAEVKTFFVDSKDSGIAGFKLKDYSAGDLPGDSGWDPLGLKPSDPKAYLELQNKELNNGRLAMIAAAGILAQETVTGEKIFR